jgi:hypothetical protein
LALPLAIWCLYLVGIGGDIFQARRHWLPAIAILALMAADVLAAGLPTLSQRARRVGLAGAMAMIVLLLGFQRRDPENYSAFNGLWPWEGMSIGTALGQAFGPARPLMAVSAAGSLPYWSKLPSLDVLGLNDHYLPRHPPKHFGRGYIGHELGDGRYVLGRQPDLVFFGGPRGNVKPIFFADQDLYAQPGFREGYVLCRFEGIAPLKTPANIWLRRDGRVGIRREAGAIAVPGYMFSGHTETWARLDDTGRFAVSASAAAPAVLPRLDVPAGRWKLAFDPPAAWRATVRQGAQTRTLSGDAHFEVESDAPVSLTLVPAGDRPANLREVRLVPAR